MTDKMAALLLHTADAAEQHEFVVHCNLMLQAMLNHWTKKIIVEEGHTVAQLVHIL